MLSEKKILGAGGTGGSSGIFVGNTFRSNTGPYIFWDKACACSADSTGAMIFISNDVGTDIGSARPALYKFSEDGSSVSWVRSLTQSGGPSYNVPYSIAVDSNDNIYVCTGGTPGNTNYTFRGWISKFSPSGTLLASKILSGGQCAALTVHVDSNDNVFVGGNVVSGGVKPAFAKFDTSLNLIWARFANTGTHVWDIASFSNGDILVCSGNIASRIAGASGSSPSVSWTNSFTGQNFSRCAIDSNDNVYVASFKYAYKANGSGAQQWRGVISNAGTERPGVCIDADDNPYFSFSGTNGSTYAMVSANASTGAEIWTNSVNSIDSSGYETGASIRYNAFQDSLVGGMVNLASPRWNFVWNCDTDGEVTNSNQTLGGINWVMNNTTASWALTGSVGFIPTTSITLYSGGWSPGGGSSSSNLSTGTLYTGTLT